VHSDYKLQSNQKPESSILSHQQPESKPNLETLKETAAASRERVSKHLSLFAYEETCLKHLEMRGHHRSEKNCDTPAL